MDVIESSNELSVISRETAVTSLEQNSGVKELLSAMEETDALSKNIAEKIGEVSLVAKKTTENIVDGFNILKQNMQKLDEIKAANDITVLLMFSGIFDEGNNLENAFKEVLWDITGANGDEDNTR